MVVLTCYKQIRFLVDENHPFTDRLTLSETLLTLQLSCRQSGWQRTGETCRPFTAKLVNDAKKTS